jgi:anti-sigma regulatory factor (Ser/Thr protein kinase)
MDEREGWSTGSRAAADGAITTRGADRPVEASGSDIRLTLPARPENVAVVRHVLGAFAEALALPTAVRDDVRLAVTEACTNVVRHAYGDEDGVIDVVMRPMGEAIEVVVADAGRGRGPSPDTAGPGLGMALIAALADSLEVERTAARGSRLVMGFLRTRQKPAMGLA